MQVLLVRILVGEVSRQSNGILIDLAKIEVAMLGKVFVVSI